MSARRVDFAEPLPSGFLYIDTSFFVSITTHITRSPVSYSTSCENYYQRLKQAIYDGHDLVLITSDFAIEETLFFFCRLFLKNNIPFTDSTSRVVYRKWHDLYKRCPEILKASKLDLMLEFFKNAPLYIASQRDIDLPDGCELFHLAGETIAKYHLLPQDAYQVALATRLEIDNFLAIDADWYRIDGINLYTCLPPP